ncbi:hypothetical protein G443_001332 [Actinoalloteichus cyanogriseus DSM 43889]|uniref:Uncharacterized protein n=1 Tax=Actinoalloteichus caeruleus DSM 43889 TaxID=1120930 RepID=A0ABT1JEY7_ACTCY|nr:hypothetical protein [Actinoalloteichus caeruleus DSM 43889]
MGKPRRPWRGPLRCPRGGGMPGGAVAGRALAVRVPAARGPGAPVLAASLGGRPSPRVAHGGGDDVGGAADATRTAAGCGRPCAWWTSSTSRVAAVGAAAVDLVFRWERWASGGSSCPSRRGRSRCGVRWRRGGDARWRSCGEAGLVCTSPACQRVDGVGGPRPRGRGGRGRDAGASGTLPRGCGRGPPRGGGWGAAANGWAAPFVGPRPEAARPRRVGERGGRCREGWGWLGWAGSPAGRPWWAVVPRPVVGAGLGGGRVSGGW